MALAEPFRRQNNPVNSRRTGKNFSALGRVIRNGEASKMLSWVSSGGSEARGSEAVESLSRGAAY